MDNDYIEKQLLSLEQYEYRIRDVGKLFMVPENDTTSPIALLAIGVMDRSVSLIYGFTTMIRANNITCAAPIIRLHLDSLLRLYALKIYQDPNRLATMVFKGEQIRLIKDRQGNKMSDRYLVDQLSLEHSWIESVYKETSGWVHLSKKHIHNSNWISDIDKELISHKISKEDNVPVFTKLEGVECMKEISLLICEFLSEWIYHQTN